MLRTKWLSSVAGGTVTDLFVIGIHPLKDAKKDSRLLARYVKSFIASYRTAFDISSAQPRKTGERRKGEEDGKR